MAREHQAYRPGSVDHPSHMYSTYNAYCCVNRLLVPEFLHIYLQLLHLALSATGLTEPEFKCV